ncbi:dUTP diphosphatase [Ornithinibacillus sp. JPR2-1]|uniref:dUTP diphosphatase n=1 Tax=Ornithinibacillus sp. JPR2-1 TaxID=2094019 RepID=UPI0031CF7D57
MNLNELFELQRKLDEHIVKEKGLEGQDLLPKKILALQVELGELCQEWRGFKFWSKNQKPNMLIEHLCPTCDTTGYDKIGPEHYDYMTPCPECYGTEKLGETNPLLEEYVDCLHFILSIGLELGFEKVKPYLVHKKTALTMFGVIFKEISKFSVVSGREHKQFYYGEILSNFIGLGKTLGFTGEQIEQAYLEKNKVNHERQREGY